MSQPQAIKRGRHALFVLYSWNYDALLTAARCSHASALCPHAHSFCGCLTRRCRQSSPLQGLDKLSSHSCSCCRSYHRAGFGSELIILDNTINSTLADDPVVAELAAEVMPTRTRLTFSQAQNFMAGVWLAMIQTLLKAVQHLICLSDVRSLFILHSVLLTAKVLTNVSRAACACHSTCEAAEHRCQCHT